MKNSQSITKLQMALTILLALTFSLIVLQYANPSIYPPGRDGGAYMFGARHLTHGKTLYVDYWEAKGPLIFFINAFGLLISGDSRWGIWLVEWLFWVFAAFLGMLTLKKQYSLLAGVFGITVMMMAGRRLVGYGNFTEEYSLLLTWVAIIAFFQLHQKPTGRVYQLVLGAMLALNFLTRANNTVTSGVLILLWLWHAFRSKSFKCGLRDAGLIAAGGLLIAVPVSAYFIIQGTFSEMVNASLIYNISYSLGTRPGVNPLNIIANAFLPALQTLGGWMVLPLVGWSVALVQFVKNTLAKRVEVINLFLVLTWPLEMLASSISGRSYGHYFLTWLPILAFLSAHALEWIIGQARPYSREKTLPDGLSTLTLAIVILLVVGLNSQPLAQYGQAFYRLIVRSGEGVEYIHPVSAFIAENSSPNDQILVWGGQTGMLFMSNRFSSTAYNFYPLYANSRIGRQLQKRYFEDLQRNQPKLILDASIHAPDSLPSLNPAYRRTQRLIHPIAQNTDDVLAYIDANYRLIWENSGYQVYRRIAP